MYGHGRETPLHSPRVLGRELCFTDVPPFSFLMVITADLGPVLLARRPKTKLL